MSVPSKSRLSPASFTRHYTDEEKRDPRVRFVAPVGGPGVVAEREGKGPTPVYHAFTVGLSPTTPHTFDATNSKGYLWHAIQTSGYNPEAASGASMKITAPDAKAMVPISILNTKGGPELKVENVGDSVTQILLFDLE
ncbi:hypothetical protein FIBSPDRAFT_935373 [Athelia psychrophila]|uniref:Uncharacterized protein n=1 Tax=Athelia psychrophila TaxID=1759441 RepID=A0A166DW71_9AGAM|nr:hypothetical protein FIBSPDRAFT_935373 [Fibularhizoctonia sp. CBS 109695]